jgi:repressor LexA
MAEPLTPIERRVYHFLLDFLAENTYQPSIREIGKRFRIKSTKTVSDLLQSLAEKGYIERDPSRSRGVRLVGYAVAGQAMPVPIYGKIQPSEPALVPENRDGYLTMNRRYLPNEDVYFLRAVGDSMIGRGICGGDLVLINPSTRATDGQVVAARHGGQITVRTLTHRGATIVLEAANASEKEMIAGPSDDFAVLGVVCGVFRPMYDAEADGSTQRNRLLEDEAEDSESDVASAASAGAHQNYRSNAVHTASAAPVY